MNTPEWFKPALAGAVVGACAIAIVGFSWAGWVGPGTASQMASDQAEEQVTAALSPICVQQARQDPQFADTFARLKEGRSYEQPNLLMATGWATMPGADEPMRSVAYACMETLDAGT